MVPVLLANRVAIFTNDISRWHQLKPETQNKNRPMILMRYAFEDLGDLKI